MSRGRALTSVVARNKRVSILRDTGTARDAYNAPITTWSPIAVVWAEKTTMGGREFLAGAEVVAEERATFNIRYRSDLKVTDQLECDGRVFKIEGLREVGNRREIEILARATG